MRYNLNFAIWFFCVIMPLSHEEIRNMETNKQKALSAALTQIAHYNLVKASYHRYGRCRKFTGY